MLPQWHLNQRILEVGLARLLLLEPDLVQTLAADAPAEMGMELNLGQRLEIQHRSVVRRHLQFNNKGSGLKDTE